MSAKKVFEGVFSRHAAAYRERLARAAARGEARGRARLIELLDVRPGARVLDLGCGPGVLTFPLAEAVGGAGRVVGVDLAEGMLALARAAAPPNVALARMDIERLALRDRAFDAVACGHSLQFCPDLGAALREAGRVLRGGGRLAASVPAGGLDVQVGRLLDDVFARLPPTPRLPERQATLERLETPDGIRTALIGAGFRDVEVVRVDDVATYAGPEELVERTMGWWSYAWRLEAVTPEERRRVRADALERLRARLGDGPIQVPGATHVAAARR